MPRYAYHCEKCDNVYEYYHDMKEKKTECEVCKEQTLLKLPHFSGTIKKQSEKKVGSIVDKYIEDTKEEIKRDKELIKKFEFKPE